MHLVLNHAKSREAEAIYECYHPKVLPLRCNQSQNTNLVFALTVHFNFTVHHSLCANICVCVCVFACCISAVRTLAVFSVSSAIGERAKERSFFLLLFFVTRGGEKY